MNTVVEEERSLYDMIWRSGKYGASSSVHSALNKLKSSTGRMLDIGCGNGILVEMLYDNDVDIHGCDITLAGIPRERLKKAPVFFERASHETLFKSNEFDYTVSTDFMEHLPEDLVMPTLLELRKITRQKTYHWICCRKDIMGSVFNATLHKTVKPMAWWEEQFIKAGFIHAQLELEQSP